MTHYYFDPKTNTLHGPLDRMPPDHAWFGKQDWKDFHAYVSQCPSHPHTFTGQSRVVPEGEIEWRYEMQDVSEQWHSVSKGFYDRRPDHQRRRVATPITVEGKRDGIDNRIADEQSMAYVRCVFCDEECKPAPTNRGWSRIRYDQGLHFDCAEKVASQGRRLESEPLTAQPDKTHRYEYSNISEYLECYGDYVLRGTWNLPADFIAVNPPPSPTPQQGEKDEARKQEIMQSAMALVRSGYTHAVLEIADLVKDKNIDLPVELSDKLLDMLNEDSKKQFNALLFEKELSAIDPAQQPHSPALQEDDEVVNILGLDNPFPLSLILQLLTKATKKLLHEKDYDGPDYEEMERCVTRANEIILLIDKYQSHQPAQPLTTDEEAVPLGELPAGSLFEHNGCYAVKSEYKTIGGAIEATIIGSGEMFWGGTDNAEDQRKLIVKPIKINI